MDKNYLETIKTSTFYIPSIIVFAGVTILYIYHFHPINVVDSVVYWLIYLFITIFLQVVIFVQAKRINKK